MDNETFSESNTESSSSSVNNQQEEKRTTSVLSSRSDENEDQVSYLSYLGNSNFNKNHHTTRYNIVLFFSILLEFNGKNI